MTSDGPEEQHIMMAQVRSLQLGAGSLLIQMHRTFALPVGSGERELAILTLRAQLEDYLTLDGNAPDTALLALGKLATEVSFALGQRAGLDSEQVTAQVEQYILAAQIGD